MRILIDLQACQSQSANRGIGRYSFSLVNAMINLNTKHEIFIALSAAFPDTIAPLRQHFSKIIPQEQIVVWHAPLALNRYQEAIPDRIHAISVLKEAFFEQFNPDFILLTSLFEGFGDNAVTSVNLLKTNRPTAIILYDLIPMLYPETYLSNTKFKSYYNQKLSELKKANLLLSISASAKKEAITHLDELPAVEIISSAAETHFKKSEHSDKEKKDFLTRFGLNKDFLMYTGGIDPRKNIDGLISAFAKLPPSLLENHQLAIVCAIRPTDRARLTEHIKKQGLSAEHVVMTGFVTEDELVLLYNFCKAFIFPSFHEGFGLPILEAMQCGAPVIGSNCSSLPEAIGYEEALFDPKDRVSITEKIIKVLTDEEFRNKLIQHGEHQASLFSWSKTAQKTVEALERFKSNQSQPCSPTQNKENAILSQKKSKPKLAFVAPCTANPNPITQKICMLLPELSKYYDVDIITDEDKIEQKIAKNYSIKNASWFIKHAKHYARVLYHIGNSKQHAYQIQCIRVIPGVIVLHDFHLRELFPETAKSTALYDAHGYQALIAEHETSNIYPCNYMFIQSAIGVIVHSQEALNLGKKWFNEPHDKPWFTIAAQEFLEEKDAALYAQSYYSAIEQSYDVLQPEKIIKNLQKLSLSQEDLLITLESMIINQPPRAIKQILIDTTNLEKNHKSYWDKIIQLIHKPPNGYRIEPIYKKRAEPFFRYAKKQTIKHLQLPTHCEKDDIVSTRKQDIYIPLITPTPEQKELFETLERRGVELILPNTNCFATEVLASSLKNHFFGAS